MLTIGAGFGLMSLSVIIADCVMLHCTKNKSLYQKIKELDIEDDKRAMREIAEEDEEEEAEEDADKEDDERFEEDEQEDGANITMETQH
jgi:uncharacterized membrane protein YhiD involved in acid resistance